MTKVFLSYRHETDSRHGERVKELGETLRAANLDVCLDQFYLESNPGGPDEGWPKWCEDQASVADKVLIVASAGYFRCYDQTESPGTGLGAACEINTIRNALLYKQGYRATNLRVVYFDKTQVSEIPNALFQINRFDVSDQKELSDLIAWLNVDSSSVTVSLPTATPIVWPPAVADYEPDLANRGAEFSFFGSMLAGIAGERALLLEAPSNCGKTTLLVECRKYVHRALGQKTYATVDFKGDPSKEFALDTLRIELAALLPKFRKPHSTPFELRTDLRALATPTVLFFDTYEKASSEARELVEGLLLADLESLPAVRIVIAGQSVPDHAKSLWAVVVRHFQLGAITDPSHWRRYSERHYRHLKPEHVEALTIAAAGNPGTLRLMLQTVDTTLPPS